MVSLPMEAVRNISYAQRLASQARLARRHAWELGEAIEARRRRHLTTLTRPRLSKLRRRLSVFSHRLTPIRGGSENPPLRYVVDDSDGIILIRLAGEVSSRNAQGIDAALNGSGDRRKPVIVDCTDIGYIDTDGVNLLIRVYARCHANSAFFAVAAPSRSVQATLEVIGCRHLLPTFPDVPAARAAVAAHHVSVPQSSSGDGARGVGAVEPVPSAALSSLAFAHTSLDGAAVLAVRGEIDLSNVRIVQDKCVEVLSTARVLLVDLSDVTYIDSAGLHALVSIYQHCRRRDVVVAVVSPFRYTLAVVFDFWPAPNDPNLHDE